MTADLGPAARREMWCVCGAPHRGPCTRCVLVDAAQPRPIPTLEDRMTAPDRIPVDCIRLGCGHTADQHHRMAGDTADTRSQDRAIRELTAERDQARENAEYYYGMLGTVAAERDAARAELGRAQELIDAAKTWRAQFQKPSTSKAPRMRALIDAVDNLPPSPGSPADRAQDDRPGCPTCSGPVRETVGMACRTCGTDYAPAGRAQDQPTRGHEIAFDEDGDWSIGHPDGCPGQAFGDCDVYRLAFDQVDAGFFNRYAGLRFQCDVNDLRDLFLLGDRIHGDRCIAEAASGTACATCGCWCHDAQDPAAPAESAQDGPAGPGEGERTQEAAQPTWDDCAMVANALNAAPGTGEIWRSTYGDIVGEPLSLARVAVEALTNAGRIAAPAERAEG